MCAPVGCGYVAELRVTGPSYFDLRRSTLRVCRNEHCAETTLERLPEQGPETPGTGEQVQGVQIQGEGGSDSVGIEVFNEDGKIVLVLEWLPIKRDFVDGDVFSATLTAGLQQWIVRKKATFAWADAGGSCVDPCRVAALVDDAPACCEPSPGPDSCMFLGGPVIDGKCSQACDFWCTENFRVENDGNGCPVWRYDERSPLPGETSYCFPAAEAGVQGDAGPDSAAHD